MQDNGLEKDEKSIAHCHLFDYLFEIAALLFYFPYLRGLKSSGVIFSTKLSMRTFSS